jgi:hypothetical protein
MNKVLVEQIYMGDSDDPYLMAAFPLADWEQTEKGQWIMNNAQEQPVYYCAVDPVRMGYQIQISAVLTEEAETEMYLRWDCK